MAGLARAVSWHRRGLAALAAAAAVLAGLAAAAPGGPPTAPVVRATRELPAGTHLSAADLELTRAVAADLPDGVVSDPSSLVGRTLTGPVARREVLTEVAVVDSARVLAPGHVLAPLRLGDAAVARLLRPGDRIDILAAHEQAEAATVVADAVRVATVPQVAADEPGGTGALVLLDVDRRTATALARAAVSATLTVIWR